MIYVPLQFAYASLALAMLVAWSFVYYIGTPQSRQRQIKRGLLIAPVGFLVENELYFHDYWFPQSIASLQIGSWHFLLEDFIFSFAMGGAAFVLYEVFSRKQVVLLRSNGVSQKIKSGLHIISLYVIAYLLAKAMMYFIGVNSIICTALIMFLFSGLIVIFFRRDLIRPYIVSGALGALMLGSVYSVGLIIVSNIDVILQDWWYLYGTKMDVRILGIPFTELIWAFSFAGFSCVVNAWIFGWKFIPRNHAAVHKIKTAY